MRLTNAECENAINKIKSVRVIGWMICCIAFCVMIFNVICTINQVEITFLVENQIFFTYLLMAMLCVGFLIIGMATRKIRNLQLNIKLNNYYDKLIDAGYTKEQAEIELERFRQQEELIQESKRIRRRRD